MAERPAGSESATRRGLQTRPLSTGSSRWLRGRRERTVSPVLRLITECTVSPFRRWPSTPSRAGRPTPAGRCCRGRCGYVAHDWAPEHGRADVAFHLAPAYWGQELMPEAVRAALAFGFERLRLHRIQATCDPANGRSGRVLEKGRMRLEGEKLRDYVFVHEAYRVLQMWAILRREWRAQQRA